MFLKDQFLLLLKKGMLVIWVHVVKIWMLPVNRLAMHLKELSLSLFKLFVQELLLPCFLVYFDHSSLKLLLLSLHPYPLGLLDDTLLDLQSPKPSLMFQFFILIGFLFSLFELVVGILQCQGFGPDRVVYHNLVSFLFQSWILPQDHFCDPVFLLGVDLSIYQQSLGLCKAGVEHLSLD